MSLKRKYRNKMFEAGFLLFEVQELSSAVKPDGTPQDTNKICESAPFKDMLKERLDWWYKALSPKSEGGWGMTYKEARQTIKNHYASTPGRKKKRSIFDFLKLSYRPKEKIKSRKQFDTAVITKSKIVRDMGQYSKKLKLKGSPRMLCRLCKGTGRLTNIEGISQSCMLCQGTGLARRRM